MYENHCAMIERHWKGIARPAESENYIRHLTGKTFPHLEDLNGFIKAAILRRPVEIGVEFLVVTTWDSIESIKQFAGEQVDVANVPPEARAMMVQFDELVRHYEVVF